MPICNDLEQTSKWAKQAQINDQNEINLIKKNMFKQFIDKTMGADIYLISSLGIFLVFFIVVSVMLIKMNKNHINYMSELPLNDDKA